MSLLAKHYLITGKVQRVYFRQSTLTEAEKLGVTGWVRNLPDGRVETTAYGSATALEKFESWLHIGPRMAEVETVEQAAIEITDPPISFTLHPTPLAE